MNFVFLLILITIVILFFINLKNYNISKYDLTKHNWEHYDYMKNHLLEHSKISNCKKPIMWIFIDFEKNARKWIDFGTKNTTDLNMPYIYLCLKTIIDNCGDNFHITIIDENSLSSLIPGWNIDLSKLSDPIKKKYINYAKLKILKNFGGIFIPPSFICKEDLYEIYYNNCIYENKIITAEFINESKSSYTEKYLPSMEFIGCNKKNNNINILIQEFEYILSKDYTHDSELNASMSKILNNNNDIINVIDGKIIGTKDNNNNEILIEDIISTKIINLSCEHVGLYIPYYTLKKRNKYNWFLYLSPVEVINSKTFVAYYLSHHI